MNCQGPEASSAVKPVRSPADIDISRHAVIEASAGTGKTYTISGLVMRLVGEVGVSIGNVLVVTFTEKATGELRQRIRDDMNLAIETGGFQWSQKFGESGPAGWKQRFGQAVECFQDARIFTIHGFCQRTLHEYAMEADSTFDLEMVDDTEVFERCMNRLKRRWALEPDIEEKFQQSGYSAGKWDKELSMLAGRYHPDFTRLEPELLPEDAIEERFYRVLEIVKPDPAADVQEQPFYRLYSGLEFNGRSKKPVLKKVITPMLECLQGWENGDYHSPIFCIADMHDQCIGAGYGRFKSDGFMSLVPKTWNKGADESMEPELRELGGILDELSMQRHAFLISTIMELSQEAAQWKEARGLMSFDDMISMLYRGLDPVLNPNAQALLSELRGACRFCLVDEAQDTDPVQAAIFKKIFLDDSRRTGCRLFVIGDPKQAIYGFRGADVNAYLSMKSAMMARGARLYNLPVNFRTLPELTRTMNRLFGGDHWFPMAEQGRAESCDEALGITFIPSRTQDDFQPDFRMENGPLVLRDPFGGRPLQYLTMTAQKGTSVPDLKTGFASRIAAAIRRLLAEPMQFVLKGRLHTLKPSDICVLVRAKKELDPISDALRREDIAFSFYRQPGLYQSAEAFYMRLMLDAAARPADSDALAAAMLTPFFNLRPDEAMEGQRAHKARDMILHASDLAVMRRWPAFFQLVLEETGVLERCALEGDERSQANLVQISWELQQDAITGNMDVHRLLRHMDSLRDGAQGTGRDSGLHMLETERDTVQVMTMHASKGLEFPVVFLYGGFTARPDMSKHHTWYDNALGLRVYDISKSHADRHRAELEAEDKRLYYVAGTRAIFRLFIPRVQGRSPGKLNGPMLQLVGNAIDIMEQHIEDIAADAAGGGSEYAPDAGTDPIGIEEQVPEQFRDALAGPGTADQSIEALLSGVKIDPCPPEVPPLEGRRINIHSYSSISDSHGSGPSGESSQGPFFGMMFSDQQEAMRDEGVLTLPDLAEPEIILQASSPFVADAALLPHEARDDLFELPPGAETGNLIHDILEHIDYAEVSRATGPDSLLEPGTATAECIQAALARHGISGCMPSGNDELPGPAELATARMIFNTLRTPVPGLAMELATIPAQARRHELEFHVALPGGSFVTGFIDLLFRAGKPCPDGKRRYYVLDWKSTSIPGGYSPEQVAMAMNEHKYHLQYSLYAWAVRRWFAMAGLDENSLAGVYYIFTRGMNPALPGNGVYFREFTPEEADAQEAMVMQALGNAEGVSL